MGKRDSWVVLKANIPLVNDFGGKCGLVPNLYLGKFKFNLCLIPREGGANPTIPNTIYTLDTFAKELVCPSVRKSIVNGIQGPWTTKCLSGAVQEGCREGLGKCIHHDLSCFTNVFPNLGSGEFLVFLTCKQVHINIPPFISLPVEY